MSNISKGSDGAAAPQPPAPGLVQIPLRRDEIAELAQIITYGETTLRRTLESARSQKKMKNASGILTIGDELIQSIPEFERRMQLIQRIKHKIARALTNTVRGTDEAMGNASP